jgi:enoyl-CoA hydratase/carnithine racemase
MPHAAGMTRDVAEPAGGANPSRASGPAGQGEGPALPDPSGEVGPSGQVGTAGWERLEVERDGPVVRVWLSRPEKRNPLDTRTLEELVALYGSLATDFGARVAVLGGRGPSFCGGADRSAPPGADRVAGPGPVTERQRRWWAQLGQRACSAIAEAEVVTVGRLHGHVVGGGLLLALACDLRVAATDARLSLPEVDLGLPLTWGGTARLVHEVGAARARQLIMLTDPVDGATAETWGLVHRAVPAGDLDTAVDDWATRLAAKPEVALHMAKSQLRALARGSELGDPTQTDGDLLLVASAIAAAQGRTVVAPRGPGPGPAPPRPGVPGSPE